MPSDLRAQGRYAHVRSQLDRILDQLGEVSRTLATSDCPEWAGTLQNAGVTVRGVRNAMLAEDYDAERKRQ